MRDAFSTEIHEVSPGTKELRLAGIIDERASTALTHAFAKLKGSNIRINFSGVVRISSFGVGLLMRLLGALRDERIEFSELSEVMVDHFQMLDFSRYGRTISFYSRHLCARCGREDSILVRVDELTMHAGEWTAPKHRCTCGGQMVIDESLEFVGEHRTT